MENVREYNSPTLAESIQYFVELDQRTDAIHRLRQLHYIRKNFENLGLSKLELSRICMARFKTQQQYIPNFD